MDVYICAGCSNKVHGFGVRIAMVGVCRIRIGRILAVFLHISCLIQHIHQLILSVLSCLSRFGSENKIQRLFSAD